MTGTNPSYHTDRGVTILGTYGSNSGGAIGVQNAGTTLTWAGRIVDLGAGGSLIKTGAGTLVLTNFDNNYTGGTYVEGGTLTVHIGFGVPVCQRKRPPDSTAT